MASPAEGFRVVALVPMRHQSERVPGKNYRSCAGRPLYHHIAETLLACEEIAEVVIDTDSPTIREDAAEHFPSITVLERPEHLKAGTVPMNDILLHDVQQVPGDFYLQTHSTNPLLRTETVARGIRAFREHYPMYDSLFSVTAVRTRYWDALGRPINHNPAILLRTQDLPPIYHENSCMYLFTREILERRHNRLGDRPLQFEMPADEAVDIDEEIDFRMAEFLLQQREAR